MFISIYKLLTVTINVTPAPVAPTVATFATVSVIFKLVARVPPTVAVNGLLYDQIGVVRTSSSACPSLNLSPNRNGCGKVMAYGPSQRLAPYITNKSMSFLIIPNSIKQLKANLQNQVNTS
jgi:hypothetical protein